MKKILASLIILFFVTPLALIFGQATPGTANQPVTAQSIDHQYALFTANPLTYKTVWTANSKGSIIKSLVGTSTDTVTAHIINCAIFNSANQLTLLSFNLPLSSGGATTVVAAVNGLATTALPAGTLILDHDGNNNIYLINGDTLQCTYNTALSNGQIIIQAFGVDL